MERIKQKYLDKNFNAYNDGLKPPPFFTSRFTDVFLPLGGVLGTFDF